MNIICPIIWRDALVKFVGSTMWWSLHDCMLSITCLQRADFYVAGLCA